MILMVCDNKNAISDFIMLADIEFVMQLEADVPGGSFGNQHFTIVDMTELGRIKGMKASEVLYVISHGTSKAASIGDYTIKWKELGKKLGEVLPGALKRIEVLACYAALPSSLGKTGIHRLANGIGEKRHGVEVLGYIGATVTNTIATVTAREAEKNEKTKSFEGPVLVIDDETSWYDEGQTPLLAEHKGEIEQFNSWCKANSGATLQQKAIKAAEMTAKFYAAYSTKFVGEKYYYQKEKGKGLRPTTVIS